MTWWHAVVESQHELMNPTSTEKIRLLGERLGLGPSSHVLDVASGRGGPAIVLAREFGCRLTCVERAPEFLADARELIRQAELEDRVELVEADAATFERLRPAAPVLAVGEPYWRSWPLPPAPELDGSSLRTDEDEWLPLPETIERAESAGVRVLSLIASSEDDWDRYESLHWQTLDTWLAANPDHPQAEEFRARGAVNRDRYLRWERAVMGWAIFVCRS
jgi:SAM-dependent methyltransferase